MRRKFRRQRHITKLSLDLSKLSPHMQGADVTQLDHCFPFRLQSLDLDTD